MGRPRQPPTLRDVAVLPAPEHALLVGLYVERESSIVMQRFQNLGPLDRTIRLLVGLLMLGAGWSGALENQVWQIALQVFAWAPLLTALLGWCPVYAMLGLSTRRSRALPRDP